VYIANKPPIHEYQHLTNVKPLTKGEIAVINKACGNGWGKVFNVYAKLLFALNSKSYHYTDKTTSWQAYRDKFLLQQNSGTALLFSAPQIEKSVLSGHLDKGCISQTLQVNTNQLNNIVHIVCGKTYGKTLSVDSHSSLTNNTLSTSTGLNKSSKSEKNTIGEIVKNHPVIKLLWLDADFAIDSNNNLIVCPYFDYRQLTNIKIQQLVEIIAS
jgi:hypothetical protein